MTRRNRLVGAGLAVGIGVLYFAAMLLCTDRLVEAIKGHGSSEVFFCHLAGSQLLLGLIVFIIARKTSYFADPGLARIIVLVAIGCSATFGLYNGALMGGAGWLLAGAVFSCPTILLALVEWRDSPIELDLNGKN